MTQHHLDRLTAVDASFLVQEASNSHMHIGAVIIVEGKAPPFGEFIEQIQERLAAVPRYRQKLAFPPGETGRPLWIDDPTFNVGYHVRHTALPSPGSEEQLLNLASRIASQQLDRSKPLWEMWIVEGLEGDRFALINKTHHALVDGVSGVDLATVLFDLERKPAKPSVEVEPWAPHPEPSQAELVAAGLRDAARGVLGIASRLVSYAQRPDRALDEVREAVEGVGEIAWAGLNPAPPTPLNVEIGPHRRLAVAKENLDDFKKVKNAFGGTVNDVVLTVVAGALRNWLRSRGVRTEGLELRALVPVSIRSSDEHGELGNRIAAMRGPLPVYIRDPVARLRFVKKSMDGLKESKQAIGAEVLAGVQQLAPPTVLAQASRLNFSTRLFNLIVTNVPGPQFPLYVLGHRLLGLYPVAFLPQNHALAVAIMSYDGKINFGLLADYDIVPDVDDIAQGIADCLAELVQLAEAQTAEGTVKPARIKKRKVVDAPKKKAKATTGKSKAKKAKSASASASAKGAELTGTSKPAKKAKPVKKAKKTGKPKTAKPAKPTAGTNGGRPAAEAKATLERSTVPEPVATSPDRPSDDGAHAPSPGLPPTGTARPKSGPAAEMRNARRASARAKRKAPAPAGK